MNGNFEIVEAPERVQELLREVQQISNARLSAMKNAAKNANLALIDKQRLDALEALASAAVQAVCTAENLRPETDGDFIVRRVPFQAMLRELHKVRKNVYGPTGCMV